MKIIDLLDKNSIKLDASPSGKEEALNMAISIMKTTYMREMP